MPKYSTHHIVLREAARALQVLGDSVASGAADVIHDRIDCATIGAIGPDLFFWGPDYELFQKILDLYCRFEELVELYDRIAEPIREIRDAVVEPFDALVESLAPRTKALIEAAITEIRETERIYEQAIATGLASAVVSGVDLLVDAAELVPLSRQFFQSFVPDLHYNRLEIHWYWFDMLHYRRTGTFARNLVNLATENANANHRRQQKAYAFGYLSHIATDVTGHPFVNQIVGAPYRLNVQAHVTAENFQDSWKHSQYYGGESINRTLASRLGLPEELPSALRNLLHDAFRITYDESPHPLRLKHALGFYSREQIDETYRNFYKALALMSKTHIERPMEPFSGVADILADALDSFGPRPSPPASASSMCSWEDVLSFGTTENSRHCYSEFFEEAERWVDYLGELARWTFETIRNLIDLLLALHLSLPISVLLAILYGIQLLCYQAYRTARYMLATTGFVMPEPDELDNSIGRRLISLAQPCAVNFKFPRMIEADQSHLICPRSFIEPPVTAGGFYHSTVRSTPNRFIREEPFSLAALRLYASQTNTPRDTRSWQWENPETAAGLNIGNATAFTAWMIRHANEDELANDIQDMLYADWNLDSDRGYGYRAWHGFIPRVPDYSIVAEQYVGEASVGINCFDHFTPDTPPTAEPDPANAYLLALVSYYAYAGNLHVDSGDINDFAPRYKWLLSRWARDANGFAFIHRQTSALDTEVAVMSTGDLTVVSFRGSEDPIAPGGIRDWFGTDANAVPVDGFPRGVLVHMGFKSAFELVSQEVKAVLDGLPSSTRVWLTGHSLGGALATLCGLWLHLEGFTVQGVYTYGAPRCGNDRFRILYESELDKRCHRWVNDGDFVTTLPPLPYVQVGIEHPINEVDQILLANAANIPQNIRAHFMELYARALYRALPETLQIVMPLPGA